MSVKDQLLKLKDNWLLILVIVVVLGFTMFSGSSGSMLSKSISNSYDQGFAAEGMMADSAYARGGYYPSPSGGDFAPEVEERKITKTASMSTKVDRGTYKDSEVRLKAILDSSDSYLLNENVNSYGTDKRAYKQGYYSIKVDTEKYESVITQLKEIGEVSSFNENAQDITGQYTNTQIEIDVEKERLVRYQEMYDEAKEISDKLELNDRIFDQERRIKYLEDSLNNMDLRIDYSTISFNMVEEQSNYVNVVLVKFSELIQKFVNSINSLFKVFFVLVPWAVAAMIIWFVARLFKRKHV